MLKDQKFKGSFYFEADETTISKHSMEDVDGFDESE